LTDDEFSMMMDVVAALGRGGVLPAVAGVGVATL
jgi:hypothetical protein